MKLLLDMNLSPRWVRTFVNQGWEAVHWADVGESQASDRVVMQWARDNDYVVLTHDLDFGTLLAASSGQKPSVVQVRTQDVLPETHAATLVGALKRFERELRDGALVVIEPARERVRVLPLK